MVIDLRIVARVLGRFLLAFAGIMLVPLGYSMFTGGADLGALGRSLVITIAAGAVLLGVPYRRSTAEIRPREGILLVVLIWTGACFFGCLPFYFSPYFPSLTDAFFESASGFTTTGATVLGRVEVLSEPIQLWRCFSHWVGGMGIVLLGVAILPLVGQGGMHLYRAEFSGAKSEKLTPRVVETAKALWGIYLALTVMEFLALMWAGMNPFEAVCQTFSTLGTGGFSTRTASIAGFNSATIEYIITVFMLLGGGSFVLYYRTLVERRIGDAMRDYELRYYVGLVSGATLIIMGILALHDYVAWEPAFRDALFQVASIITTTGFMTVDYAHWFPLCQLILLALMFVGGCTGSTAGGLKVSRIVLLTRVVDREFRRMSEPQGVFRVRVSDNLIPETAINGLLNLVYLAWVVNFLACLLLAATGVDILTSLSAVAACMFNVGPGFGDVGPAENYGGLPGLAKWVLSGCMIAGRLEFYTLIVIITSRFWQR